MPARTACSRTDGYREYADDLLKRMTNPYLGDSVERVGRDPHRKLGWDDRLIGTMRVAMEQSVVPQRYAMGAAAALAMLDLTFLKTDTPARALLAPLWGNEAMKTKAAEEILSLIEDAKQRLKQ